MDEQADDGDRSHALIVGPPGSGKSHIMTYLQKILKRFNESTHTIVIQEETRSILSLFDFILSCLRYIESITPETIVERLQSRSPEPLYAIQKLFDDHLSGNPTAIFIEDFSDLFENMSHADRREMRTFFAERPHVKLIASSVSSLEENQVTLGSISRMFNVRTLLELSLEETSSFLGRMLFDKKRVPARLKSLLQTMHHLTGGNPGLMEAIGRFSTDFDGKDLDSVIEPLVKDILIPHYARRLEHLDADAQKILRELARRLGQAMTLDDLAKSVSLSDENLERHLNRLQQQNILTHSEYENATYYDIHEPLFRSFLLYGDHASVSLTPPIHFIAAWFDVEHETERYRLKREHVDEADLARAVALFESGARDEAHELFNKVWSIEHSNPTVAAYTFRHKLDTNPEGAFSYLEDYLRVRPLELIHPVEVMELLLDYCADDSPHHNRLLQVYRENDLYILEGLIHRFLTAKDSGSAKALGDVRKVVNQLALDIPSFGILGEELRQCSKDRMGLQDLLLHIPVELRKLVLKRLEIREAIYGKPDESLT